MTWGLKEKKRYPLDILRRRLEYPQLKRTIRDHAAEWSARNILIEDKAPGTQFSQELIHEGVHGVTRYLPKMEKRMRLQSTTPTIEGRVRLPTRRGPMADRLSSRADDLPVWEIQRSDRFYLAGARLDQGWVLGPGVGEARSRQSYDRRGQAGRSQGDGREIRSPARKTPNAASIWTGSLSPLVVNRRRLSRQAQVCLAVRK
jgi:hypothetical protein